MGSSVRQPCLCLLPSENVTFLSLLITQGHQQCLSQLPSLSTEDVLDFPSPALTTLCVSSLCARAYCPPEMVHTEVNKVLSSLTGLRCAPGS